MTMTDIGSAKYVRLTTHTKDGRDKHSPVWITDLNEGKVGFTTGSTSWKAKRISHTPAVSLQPSNAKGVPKEGSAVVSGSAEIVVGDEFDAVMASIKGKYGFQVTMVKALHAVSKLFGSKNEASDCAVVITLDA